MKLPLPYIIPDQLAFLLRGVTEPMLSTVLDSNSGRQCQPFAVFFGLFAVLLGNVLCPNITDYSHQRIYVIPLNICFRLSARGGLSVRVTGSE